MNTRNLILSLSLVGLSSANVFAAPDTPVNTPPVNNETTTHNSGKFSVDARYRFENVDQAGLAEKSKASTLRTRLGYQTAQYKGFSLFAELDDVRNIGAQDYTTPSGGAVATPEGPKQAGYPVVADPIDTALNQLHIAYRNDSTTVIGGRQRIIRGDSRFVGNVGWRQHEQTYDGVTIENKSIDNITLFAAYLAKRNTITFTDIDQDTFLFDAQYTGLENAKLSVYYYDIKVDHTNNKWRNIGARYAGKVNKFSYVLELATQKNGAGASPDYKHAEGTYKFAPFSLTAGIEVLGSDENTGFATPLATLHKFNGWADKFLSTPKNGLEDKFVKVATKLKGVKLAAVYHTFDSDAASTDYGSEWDAVVSGKVHKNITLGAKLADYDAGDAQSGKTDTKKVWLWAQAKF